MSETMKQVMGGLVRLKSGTSVYDLKGNCQDDDYPTDGIYYAQWDGDVWLLSHYRVVSGIDHTGNRRQEHVEPKGPHMYCTDFGSVVFEQPNINAIPWLMDYIERLHSALKDVSQINYSLTASIDQKINEALELPDYADDGTENLPEDTIPDKD